MSDNQDRLRQHPEQRFASEALRYDLNEEGKSLAAKSSPGGVAGLRQETLYKGSDINHGPTTIALFDLDAGATLPPHQAGGVVSIHVLAGRIQVAAAGEEHDLAADQMLVMPPNVRHDLRAVDASRMLLTVCLEPDAAAKDRSSDDR